ncbi:MAG: outer membrane protein transport protein [Campylobacterota bacterium]|nr:outer membrane protein transport protein [Campylobacterota bacterium]
MGNILLKTTTLTILSSSLLIASGWRLPESSAKSTALSGAYIANANGADATYYNPANISFNPNIAQVELSLTNVNLKKIQYTDNITPLYNGDSKEENTLIPTLFLTSASYDDPKLRYGFSITVPGGLTKRWDEAYAKTFAQEFSLRIIEFNPTAAYLLNSNLSIGGGLRVIYSDGIVKSDGGTSKPIKRDLEGTTVEFGYNLALAYKPTDTTNLSFTYRSNVDLKEDGNAKLYLSGTKVFDGGANVTVPLPAALSVAYSFKIENTTFEIEADRTYWSSYEELDFEYDSAIPAALVPYFDLAKERDWKDTNAYRIGITHKLDDTVTMMIGFSKDGNPIPDKAVSFESPDYNSNTYSAGFDYNLDDKSSFGFAYLFSKKKDRSVTNYLSDGTTYIDGTLTNSEAHLLTLSYRVDF